MLPAARLRERLARRELTTGVLATQHVWPELVEVCQRAGLDYLIIDAEHGVASPELIAEVCALGRHLNFPVLLRPNNNEYATLRLGIDLGPCGFLLACVESSQQLDVVQKSIYLPPRGQRRPGGAGNRWVANYRYEAWKTEIEDHFLVLPQIETRVGLSNVADIAGHPVTTALAMGPYDLSAELGVCGIMDAPELNSAIAECRQAATAAGKELWMIGNAPQLASEGLRFLCVGEPTWMLEAAIRQTVENTRKQASDSTG
jgi:2-keto-3-deoxy-L-rhamnonate aldolase RhmA